MIDTLVQWLIDWGYPGLFLSAFLAGSLIPFSSEIVLLTLVKLGLNPVVCLVLATLGNTLGGMTCYGMGWAGRTDWIERYLHVKQDKVDRMQRFLQGKGSMMAFFAFLPFVGGVLAVALGFMRSNITLTTISMMMGKLLRYIVLLWAMQETLQLVM
ncbi:MAG: YqaA family protein [Bacteroides sp.]